MLLESANDALRSSDMFGHYFARRGRFGSGSGPFDPFGFGGQENWRGWGPFGGWGGGPGRRGDRGGGQVLILSGPEGGPKHANHRLAALPPPTPPPPT